MDKKKEIVKEYKADGLTIVWKPGMCIHTGVCVKSLPKVYNPARKPWIETRHASKQQLIEQIDSCPSGALSYTLHSDK